MAAPKFYSYDPVSFEYLGFGFADPSPLQRNVWLFPAQSTQIPPVAVGPHHVPVWNGRNWDKAINRRGETWYKEDGTPVLIDFLGEPSDYGLLEDQPTVAPPAPEPVEITAESIDRERDKRINSGFVFDGRLFDFDPASKIRIAGMGALAGFACLDGKGDDPLWHGGAEPFVWIDARNEFVIMDARTAFEFAKTASRWEADHIRAARAIKDRDHLPEDFRDDAYWPALT